MRRKIWARASSAPLREHGLALAPELDGRLITEAECEEESRSTCRNASFAPASMKAPLAQLPPHTDLSHEQPMILLSNDTRATARQLVTRYAKRLLIENAILFFHCDALSASGFKGDFGGLGRPRHRSLSPDGPAHARL